MSSRHLIRDSNVTLHSQLSRSELEIHIPSLAQHPIAPSKRHLTLRSIVQLFIFSSISASNMSIAGWALFGVAVRWWQLGIEMRPFLAKNAIMGYPIYGAVAAGFGYWIGGVEQRQMNILNGRREKLLEKRKRQAEKDAGFVVGAQA
ncbi:hypothetical protein RUND412_006360 [Rhizina undulata]